VQSGERVDDALQPIRIDRVEDDRRDLVDRHDLEPVPRIVH
jgi:hypothetical protein